MHPSLMHYRAGPPKPTIDFESFIALPREPQSAHEYRMQHLVTTSEEDEERARLHAQMAEKNRFTPKKCQELWEEEVERCGQRWNGRNRSACELRAGDRLRDCRTNGRYTIKEWGFADLDMPEIEKEEFRKRFGTKGTQTNSEPEPNPNSDDTSKPEENPKTQGNPYVFGPPWGSPTIYRAPLMPPDLQRKIPHPNSLLHIPPELALRLALMVLLRRPVGRMVPALPRSGISPVPSGSFVPRAMNP
jgi:hypothetical protein